MKKLAIATATLALAALAQTANAAEYCVVCAGPDTTYRCQVAGAAAEDSGGDPRMQLLCISELARSGRHDTCSIDRKATATDQGTGQTCVGEIRVIAAPSTSPPPGAPQQAADAPAGAEHTMPAAETDHPTDQAPPQSAEETPPDKVPQTVEELAGQTMKSSQENFKKAGEAIGGTGQAIAGGAKQAGEKIGEAGSSVGTAAKKTWKCLASLFSDC